MNNEEPLKLEVYIPGDQVSKMRDRVQVTEYVELKEEIHNVKRDIAALRDEVDAKMEPINNLVTKVDKLMEAVAEIQAKIK